MELLKLFHYKRESTCHTQVVRFFLESGQIMILQGRGGGNRADCGSSNKSVWSKFKKEKKKLS